MTSDYEKQRLINIERNKALLAELGLDKPFFEPKEKLPANRKRKGRDSDQGAPKPKLPRLDSATSSEGGESSEDVSSVRRSARNRGKTVDYKAEKSTENPMPISFQAGIRETGNEGPLGGTRDKRIHDPKTYGSIPGIEVGTWWEMRSACSVDAVHAPFVAGISSGPKGAYSVALSGGYEDDVDLGYAFTYTGSGGRDLKGTKAQPKNLRTAAQSFDQSFDNNSNKSLKTSSETKRPVRVIRGFKLKSPYAPSEGYRYDGLYQVEKAWLEEGLEGFMVCKFAFKRLPGQPPLPRRDIEDTE